MSCLTLSDGRFVGTPAGERILERRGGLGAESVGSDTGAQKCRFDRPEFAMQSGTTNYLRGALFGFAAASTWAGWTAMTRLAVTTSLDAWDIVALRFGVAGLLLSPIVVRRGLALDRLGWLGLAGIIAGNGAPYALVAP